MSDQVSRPAKTSQGSLLGIVNDVFTGMSPEGIEAESVECPAPTAPLGRWETAGLSILRMMILGEFLMVEGPIAAIYWAESWQRPGVPALTCLFPFAATAVI